jgi:hypothetical protein
MKTPAQKTAFIEQLLETLKGELLANVEKMPEEWDGFEIRQYVADKAQMGSYAWKRQPKSRRKNYENDNIILGL